MKAITLRFQLIILCMMLVGAQKAECALYTFSFDSLNAYETNDPSLVAPTIEAYMEGILGSNVTVTGAIVGGGSGLKLDGTLGADSYLRSNVDFAECTDSFTITFEDISLTSVTFEYGTVLSHFVAEAKEENSGYVPILDETYHFFPYSGSLLYDFNTSEDFDGPVTSLFFHDGFLGDIGIDSLTITTVPVPGALFLFSSSIVCAACLRRKKDIE